MLETSLKPRQAALLNQIRKAEDELAAIDKSARERIELAYPWNQRRPSDARWILWKLSGMQAVDDLERTMPKTSWHRTFHQLADAGLIELVSDSTTKLFCGTTDAGRKYLHGLNGGVHVDATD